MEWFQEHASEFLLQPWPPNSPDMIQIEHFWFHLEKRVCATSPPPCNLQKTGEHAVDIMVSDTPGDFSPLR